MTIRPLTIALALAAPAAAVAAEAPVSAEIDWFHELTLGGSTGIALFVLMFALVTIAVERLVNLRRRHLIPPGFVDRALPLWHRDSADELLAVCREHPSTLARMTAFLANHRDAEAALLMDGAAEIGARELMNEQRKTYSLSVIAAVAPLLGLLGTIIGMVEAFKLVELYGDEGGATILAGSISKALITTVLGLVIAIPALMLYHFFKLRIQELGRQLDEEMEKLLHAWLLKRPRG